MHSVINLGPLGPLSPLGPILRYGTLRHATARYGTLRHATARYGTLRHATPRFATPRYATLQPGKTAGPVGVGGVWDVWVGGVGCVRVVWCGGCRVVGRGCGVWWCVGVFSPLALEHSQVCTLCDFGHLQFIL
jgi:hypothetical protein